MKRIFALVLALTMTLCLFACGGNSNADAEIGGGGAQSGSVDMGKEKEETTTEGTADEGVFSFTFEGIELVPGDSFGYAGYVRISYCVATEMIEISLPSFEKLAKEYK